MKSKEEYIDDYLANILNETGAPMRSSKGTGITVPITIRNADAVLTGQLDILRKEFRCCNSRTGFPIPRLPEVSFENSDNRQRFRIDNVITPDTPPSVIFNLEAVQTEKGLIDSFWLAVSDWYIHHMGTSFDYELDSGEYLDKEGDPYIENNFVRQCGLNKTSSVLDVGTGTGALAMLARKITGATIVALDAAPGMLRTARNRSIAMFDNINYCRGSSIRMPFAAQAFDVALAGLMFSYLPEILRIRSIREMHRISSQGIGIYEFCEGEGGFHQAWTGKEWEAQLKNAGFNRVKVLSPNTMPKVHLIFANK